MSNPPPPVPVTPPARFGVTAWAGSIVGLLFCFARAWIWCKGNFTSEAQGYAVGSVLVCGGIAYAIAGRQKVRNPTRFGLWFCGLGLLSVLIELSSHAGN